MGADWLGSLEPDIWPSFTQCHPLAIPEMVPQWRVEAAEAAYNEGGVVSPCRLAPRAASFAKPSTRSVPKALIQPDR